MASSPLTHRALQHHASCFSIRGNMRSTRSSRDEETYYDDGLTPRALNIRRPPHLRESMSSPTRRYTTQSESTEESRDSTPRGPLRVMNPEVGHDYRDHRRAAVYMVSSACLLPRDLTDFAAIPCSGSSAASGHAPTLHLNSILQISPQLIWFRDYQHYQASQVEAKGFNWI